MEQHDSQGPLKPGDRAPNVVLDAITRGGKIAIDDFRGRKPVLVGLFRGLHCPFCRRQIAAMAELETPLRDQGIDSLTVVNTPIERARLYLRYHPIPNLLAASDPERVSHRAFGLPNLEFTENDDQWPYKLSMGTIMKMHIDLPGELPEPMDPMTASDFLDKLDGYEVMDADLQMMADGQGQLAGEFLLDRDGIVRWCFTEVPGGGRQLFASPNRQELMSTAAQLAA
ncbi:peroxiredoxin-like family protein [Pararhizobium sp. LjRoot238]|uniref:peroxiredoxin-like family protein n=1 Tax=Pararhizobium sp. LjRoot238 TaxID=3342293 RepID=UPI003ED0080E